MLSEARRRLHEAGLGGRFVQADARALPLRTESVDCIALVTVLGEIPDRSRALVEMKRVLRARGRLCVGEQFFDPDFVTPSALRRELTRAGFVEIRTRGRLFYTSTWSKTPANAPAHSERSG
jgi:ubiquinone/menaquinone biosynthesis C-methylase UbiE